MSASVPTVEAVEEALGAMNCAPTGLADGVGARFIAPVKGRQRACRGFSTASAAIMGWLIVWLPTFAHAQTPDPIDLFTEQFEHYAELAKSPNEAQRLAAIGGFGWLKHHSAERRLLLLAEDASPSVRRETAYALGRVGRRDSVPILMAMLSDWDDGVAKQARASLQRLTQLDDPTPEWWAATSADAYEAELLAKLVEPDAATRLKALRALRCFAGPAAEPTILQFLTGAQPGPDAEQTDAAIEVLERIGTEASLDLLCAVVENRPNACWALGNIGGPRAEDALLKAAGRHWNYAADPQLLVNLDRLHSTKCGPIVAAMVYSFGCITFRGQPEDLTYEPTPVQRTATNLILRSGRGPELVELVLSEMEVCGEDEAIPADLRDQIVLLRGELAPGFIRNDGTTTSQPMCAMSLVIRDRSLAPRLVPLLRHPAYVARIYAALALGRLQAVEGLPEIVKIVDDGYAFADAVTLVSGKHFGDSQTVRYKGFLCMALGHMGGEDARLALERWCSDPNEFRDIRYGSVVGLKFRADPASLPALRHVAETDIIWRIRDEAQRAIEAIELVSQPD